MESRKQMNQMIATCMMPTVFRVFARCAASVRPTKGVLPILLTLLEEPDEHLDSSSASSHRPARTRADGAFVSISPTGTGFKAGIFKRNKYQQIQLVMELPFDIAGTVQNKGSS